MKAKKPSVKLNTVNVIEIVCGNIGALHSFKDNSAGNKKAELLFTTLMLENGGNKEDVDAALEDGNFSIGDYEVNIVHSV